MTGALQDVHPYLSKAAQVNLPKPPIILAEIDGMLVGSVNVNLMDGGVGEFGILVADLNHRGKGIGSALVDRAETWGSVLDAMLPGFIAKIDPVKNRAASGAGWGASHHTT